MLVGIGTRESANFDATEGYSDEACTPTWHGERSVTARLPTCIQGLSTIPSWPDGKIHSPLPSADASDSNWPGAAADVRWLAGALTALE